ncbi:MAG: hypothetical protein ABSE00_10655 [Chitinispirillaceae bacterium]|jgi:hypothetical protein
MKHSLTAFSILALAFACVAFSQDKPNAAPVGRDSVQQMMPGPGGAAKGCCMKEKMMSGSQCCPGGFMPGGGFCMQDHRFMQPGCFMSRHPKLFPVCIAFFLMIIALLNILLTILVCADMAKLGAFKAIWIPIILLFGIPGTGLYALFRIGDMIKAATK